MLLSIQTDSLARSSIKHLRVNSRCLIGCELHLSLRPRTFVSKLNFSVFWLLYFPLPRAQRNVFLGTTAVACAANNRYNVISFNCRSVSTAKCSVHPAVCWCTHNVAHGHTRACCQGQRPINSNCCVWHGPFAIVDDIKNDLGPNMWRIPSKNKGMRTRTRISHVLLWDVLCLDGMYYVWTPN